MNMLILDEAEPGRPLPRSDRRVQHIVRILKKKAGDELLAGLADDGQGPLAGQIGTARIESWDHQNMILSFRAERIAPLLHPLTLLLGFPRPIQGNRILKDLCSLGVARIILCGTELGERSYFQSDFFRNRDFRSALVEGAEQAANPRLPSVETAWTLAKALKLLEGPSPSDTIPSPGIPAPPAITARWALDPYRQEGPLGRMLAEDRSLGLGSTGLVLAIGSERGWTQAELDLLAAGGFRFAGLGERILKTETAAVAGTALALARLALI